MSFSPSLRPSGRINEIGGGETVEVELPTGFILNNTSFKGAVLEFSMLEHAWSLWRSAYLLSSSQ
ncbi:MAG: hypothetical protein JW934_23525 [Anaerolineae bacterium]|nr:hypothetical protein [Anaerolineae bacterium]